MKTKITRFPLKTFFLALCLFLTWQFGATQIAWDGGGDGTSWDDPANWNPDMVPPADSFIVFGIDAVVTGTATETYMRINIQEKTTVTLDLDLSMGDGVADVHGIVLGDSCTLNLGAGEARTFTFNQNTTKQALPAFNNAKNATLYIAENAFVNILQARNGINIVNATSSAIIDGTVNCEGGVRNGIKCGGMITNNGNLFFEESGNVGIEVGGGDFVNNGNITVNKPNDDCIEIFDGGTFTNNAMLNLTAQDSAGTSNNAISVGTADEAGTFINAPEGVVVGHSGEKSNGRAIFVDEMGILENYGEMSLTGFPESGARYYNRGGSTNGNGGLMDLNDGRINVNQGSFTNSGLLISSREGSGVFTTASSSAVNNAFYDYNMANEFAIGDGMIEDNGINVNDTARTTIDAEGSCTVDLGDAAYAWFEGDNLIDTSDENGMLTFPEMSLSGDPAVLTNGSFPGVSITVENMCPEATSTTSVNTGIVARKLTMYPTLITNQELLTMEFPQQIMDNALEIAIYNLSGVAVHTCTPGNTQKLQVRVDHLPNGIYIVNGYSGKEVLRGRFVIEK